MVTARGMSWLWKKRSWYDMEKLRMEITDKLFTAFKIYLLNFKIKLSIPKINTRAWQSSYVIVDSTLRLPFSFISLAESLEIENSIPWGRSVGILLNGTSFSFALSYEVQFIFRGTTFIESFQDWFFHSHFDKFPRLLP